MRTVTAQRVIENAHVILSLHRRGASIEPQTLEWAEHIVDANANGGTMELCKTPRDPMCDGSGQCKQGRCGSSPPNALRQWLLDPVQVGITPQDLQMMRNAGMQNVAGLEPDREPIETEPGALEETNHSTESTGVILSVGLAFACICIGWGLASWWPEISAGWDRFLAWGF